MARQTKLATLVSVDTGSRLGSVARELEVFLSIDLRRWCDSTTPAAVGFQSLLDVTVTWYAAGRRGVLSGTQLSLALLLKLIVYLRKTHTLSNFPPRLVQLKYFMSVLRLP